MYLSSLSMAYENLNFLLAALRWKKGEFNQVVPFGSCLFIPSYFPGLCGLLFQYPR